MTKEEKEAIKWWNSLTKSERRELRIEQIGLEQYENSFSIHPREILELYNKNYSE